MDDNANNLFTIAFYNLENLFDTLDDPDTLDDDFTPGGRKKWNEKRYQRKIKKLGAAIAQIGQNESNRHPSIIGIAEVENHQVIKDLVNTKYLKDQGYGIVHYDALDERGIEVAMLYRKEDFELIDAKSIPLFLFNDEGVRDYTRDILLVKGKLKGELIYCIVNHWPSRRKGTEETQPKRIKAAERVREIISEIIPKKPDARIIVMGDFNDNPDNISVKKHLVSSDLYNPFESLFDKGRGTATRDKEWYLFDQIMFSKTLFDESESLVFRKAYIFNEYFLKSWKGKRKGSPFRTYIGKWHQGGYSDHFPVYITVEKK